MTKKITYRIFPESRLITEFYSGEILVKDFIEKNKTVVSQNDYDPKYFVIMDFRDAHLNVNEDEMQQFIEYLKMNSKLNADRKIACLTQTPSVVATSTIYSILVNNNNLVFTYKVFSTFEAILRWFYNINISVNELNNYYKELSLKPNMIPSL